MVVKNSNEHSFANDQTGNSGIDVSKDKFNNSKGGAPSFIAPVDSSTSGIITRSFVNDLSKDSDAED